MNYTKQEISVSLGSDILYSDGSAKMFWALVQEALKRGEEVTATFKHVGLNLDQRSLVQKGKDEQGLPIFGVGGGTKIVVQLAMMVDVSVPAPEEAPVDETAVDS